MARELTGYEVVVVGAGSAGATAALAASQLGARTLLIDRLPFAGGTSTGVLDTFYGFYTPGNEAKKVVGGIPDQVVAELKKIGPVVERPNTYGAGTGVTYNPEHLKVAWERLLRKSNVSLLLHSLVHEVKNQNGRITEITLANRAGIYRVSGQIFIDCSGDADLTHLAGFSYERAGDISAAQTLTTTFRMVNVDMKERKSITKDRLHELMQEAASEGYELPRREGSDHITTVPNTTATVMTRLDSIRKNQDGFESVVEDPFFLTESEMKGREQALEYARFLKDKVPGYKDSDIYGLSTFLGIRETRRVYGDYRVTREDVLTARQFDDQIGLCGAPIEDHHSGDGTQWRYLPEGSAVGIPLSALRVKDSENTLVAGRCFSASHDAHASIRSMAQCMAMGAAAGVNAALAVKETKTIREIPITDVQRKLREGGAILSLQ
ncbi:MAG TPA: FAD-dependent oxidoreductase [Candidatus Nanopelagicaceae bacterium]